MTNVPDRRDRLAEYSSERGSMVLVTERRRALGPMSCEVCNEQHPGGFARGIVLDEPGQETPWLLWMLADGWSESDHGAMAACPQHQSDPLLKTMRFVE